MEFRSFRLKDMETRDKGNTGYISGLVSESGVYEPDFGTTFREGAWRRTLDVQEGKFPLLYMHQFTMPAGLGQFSESKRGLELDEAQVDLSVETGRLVYSGAQRGYIDTLSQGFDVVGWKPDPDSSHKEKSSFGDQAAKIVTEVKLFESSFVLRGFEGNPGAAIESVRAVTYGIERVNEALRQNAMTEFETAMLELRTLLESTGSRAVVGFKSFPLAERDRKWDNAAAEKRVRSWAGAEDTPNAKYRSAHMWYDASAPDKFGSYKLLYLDIVDGQARAVPKGIFAVAGALQGAREPLKVPAADIPKLRALVEKWYAKMSKEFDDEDIVAPWKRAIEVPPEIRGLQEISALLKGVGSPEGTHTDEDSQVLEQFRAIGREIRKSKKVS